MVMTPSTSEWVLNVIGGGHRGGGQRDPLDVAWLELAPQAAAAAERHYLDLSRLGPYRDGSNEDLCVYGGPIQLQQRGRQGGLPSVTAVTSMWVTRAMSAAELVDVDRTNRLHLLWPRVVTGRNDDTYEYPEAPGLSGGAIWSLNIKGHGQEWRADQTQLIGVQFAVQRDQGQRFLIGQQIQVWLAMLAQDIPKLAPIINEHLAGARVVLRTK